MQVQGILVVKAWDTWDTFLFQGIAVKFFYYNIS